MAESHVLFMPIHLSPEGLSVLGVCTVNLLINDIRETPGEHAYFENAVNKISGVALPRQRRSELIRRRRNNLTAKSLNQNYITEQRDNMKGKMVRPAHSAGGDRCDYSVKKRRSGIELVVECGDCKAEPGLENARCFRSVLTAMQLEGAPVAVTLRSHVERRYGSAAAQTMNLISGIMNRIESLQSQLVRDSTKSAACADCLHPLTGKLAVMGRGFGSMDINNAISVANSLEGHAFPNRPGCADCVGEYFSL